MRFRKILLPIDLSPEGERALQPVAALAREDRSAVVLLHVVENVGIAPAGEGFSAPRLLPGTQQELERARAELARRRALFGSDVEVATEALVAPSVPHAIAEYATRHGCDVIALSTHGRSGFRRLIMGSVTEAVLRMARVPVLVFPRAE